MLTADDARAIAKDAYVYGFPMVDSYRIQHAYFVDPTNPEYKGAWNTVHSAARVFTSDDTVIQTPNSDTPYAMLGADLRAEPLVLTVPEVEKDHYYSLAFIDGYTTGYDFVGTRTTGNGAGKYLLAGPGWNGAIPAGISGVIRSETDFTLVIYRTQLFDPADLDNVKTIQAGYTAEPLSAFLGTEPAPPAPADFVRPLSAAEQRTSIEFFNVLNHVLASAPVLPDEQDVRDRFAQLGIGAGLDFNAGLTDELRAAVAAGIADAWAEYDTFKTTQVDTGKVGSGEMSVPREQLGGNYLYRMAIAVIGIFGLPAVEAMYPILPVDTTGAPLDGANRYTVHLDADALPPVNAFWSVTMYRMPESLLVANPINRYLINSPMLPSLIRDADGGITLYVQNESPGSDLEPNWLPAPSGAFTMIMRLYWPQQAALDGTWRAPGVNRA